MPDPGSPNRAAPWWWRIGGDTRADDPPERSATLASSPSAAAGPSPIRITSSSPCGRQRARSTSLTSSSRRSLRTRDRVRRSSRPAPGCGRGHDDRRLARRAAMPWPRPETCGGSTACRLRCRPGRGRRTRRRARARCGRLRDQGRTCCRAGRRGRGAGRLECRWQRDQLPEAIRELVLDDQRLRNDICWSVFDC